MHTIPALLLLFAMFVGYHFGGYMFACHIAIGYAVGALLINLIRGK